MPIVLKSRRLNLLEHSGPVQACKGVALPLPLPLPFYFHDLFQVLLVLIIIIIIIIIIIKLCFEIDVHFTRILFCVNVH